MKKVWRTIVSVLIGGGGSTGAAMWMVNDPASFKMVLLTTFVGCAVACIAYSVYLFLETVYE